MSFKIKYFLLPVFVFLYINSNSQEICDTIFASDKVDELAVFPVSQREFNKFLEKKIIPLVSEEVEKTKKIIPHLNMLFTISQEGNIIKIEFPKLDSSKELQEKMAKEFIALGKWTPGILKKQKVCSEFYYRIACIKWQ